MPIRREHRGFYPIDWPQLSAVIRFRRAAGRCETCGRPHGQTVWHLGDGRWWDAQAGSWRDGAGRVVCLAVDANDVLGSVRTTRVVLATAQVACELKVAEQDARGVMRETPRGVRVPLVRLADTIAALQAAEREAQRLGLLPGAKPPARRSKE